MKGLFAESRLSLVRTLWESMIAPLAPVNFWHVIVADYTTSLAKAFSDLQLATCISAAIVQTPADAAQGVHGLPASADEGRGGGRQARRRGEL